MTEREVATIAAELTGYAAAVLTVAEAGVFDTEGSAAWGGIAKRMGEHADALLTLIPERPVEVRDCEHPDEMRWKDYAEGGAARCLSRKGVVSDAESD